MAKYLIFFNTFNIKIDIEIEYSQFIYFSPLIMK